MESRPELEEKKFLPHLIFSESHDDPIVKRILQILLTELKSMGYLSFYDEVSEDFTVTNILDILKEKEKIIKY